ncbi:MAG TPA: hypothetical protein VNX28_05590 [Gemmataceae bacterium]|jgi:hypothetical protein|nr:hypothetical protein [Gemmataceae bacterium]
MREKLQRRIPYHGSDDIYRQRTNVPYPICIEKITYLLGRNGFPSFPFIFAVYGVLRTTAFHGMQLDGSNWGRIAPKLPALIGDSTDTGAA